MNGREVNPALRDAVAGLLRALDPPADADIAGTPERVATLWAENLTSGYQTNSAAVLRDRLPHTGAGTILTVTDLPLHGMCPHHLLPFVGVAHVAYEPSNAIVGLGVIEQLVTTLSRRLTLQETLTAEIVEALMVHLEARGAACVIEAQHLCLSLRGREPRDARVVSRLARGTLEGRPEVLPPIRGWQR